MPEPTPFESVASILEQILDLLRDQLSVIVDLGQEQLAVSKDQLDVMEDELQVARESLENLQALNGRVDATNSALSSLIAWTKDSNGILQALLESSIRIEKLLGGTGPVPAPASMKVTYQFELTKKAKEKS